jgi:hypothetical protein
MIVSLTMCGAKLVAAPALLLQGNGRLQRLHRESERDDLIGPGQCAMPIDQEQMFGRYEKFEKGYGRRDWS